jgi:hypothetical protein
MENLERVLNKNEVKEMQKRSFTLTETEVQGRTIYGQIRYMSPGVDMGGYVELISPNAFKNTLASGSKILALWNHSPGKVLGNTKAGTLRLRNTSKALHFEIVMPNNTLGNDTLETVRRGDVNGVSFGMKVSERHWNHRAKPPQCFIDEAVLYEISLVSLPVYEGSATIDGIRRIDKVNESLEKIGLVLDAVETVERHKRIEHVKRVAAKIEAKQRVENEKYWDAYFERRSKFFKKHENMLITDIPKEWGEDIGGYVSFLFDRRENLIRRTGLERVLRIEKIEENIRQREAAKAAKNRRLQERIERLDKSIDEMRRKELKGQAAEEQLERDRKKWIETAGSYQQGPLPKFPNG